MQPVEAPQCSKCGANLPSGEGEVRCPYCGTVHRARAAFPAKQALFPSPPQQAPIPVGFTPPPQKKALGPWGCLGIGCVGVFVASLIGFGVLVWMAPATKDAALRLNGSNTIGAEVAPSLVEAFMKSKSAANVARSTDGKKATVTGTMPGETTATNVSIEALGTSTAFTALSQGKCDIAMASRRITDAEKASIPDAKESVIGLDGIAVVVNTSNRVEQLDTDQLGRIFRGDAKNWSDVGGAPGPITVFARDANSGTWDTFRGLVLATGALVDGAQRFESNEQLVAAVARTPGAIGFSSLGAAKGAKVVAIGEPGTTPILPTAFTISTETYPLTRRLYLYTTKPHLLGDAFVAFAQSPEGQTLVSKAGFVDLTPKSDPTPAAECKGCTSDYKKATTGATRMSVDFRFETGSTNLDSRGKRDVERIGNFARSQKAKKVILLGFADSQGAPMVNQQISLERARAVQLQVKDASLDAAAIGLGDTMPVASNASPDGRERNRRVEVWVAK